MTTQSPPDAEAIFSNDSYCMRLRKEFSKPTGKRYSDCHVLNHTLSRKGPRDPPDPGSMRAPRDHWAERPQLALQLSEDSVTSADRSTESSTDPSELSAAAPPKQVPKDVKTLASVKYLGACLSFLAWACVLFVPLWKIIDTSYLFRERDDPSMFDKVTDYFSSDSNWPFASFVDKGKDTYRIYFFIVPFILGFLLLSISSLLRRKYGRLSLVPSMPADLNCRIAFGCSALDLILIAATFVYSVILIAVRQKRCLTQGARKLTFLYVEDSKEPIDPFSWEATEIFGKTLGVLTITILGWFVLMPIARRSVLLDLLEVPRESAIKFHRWLGWYTLWALLAHTFVYIAVWAHANGHPKYNPNGDLLRQMMVPGSCRNGACDEETALLHKEVMFGFACLAMVLLMCATAVNYIRRYFYEVFLYTHQLFVLLILFLAFHYNKTPLYILPCVVMILIDKLIGFLAYAGSVTSYTKTLTNDMIELRVQKPQDVHPGAGQFVFLSVPKVSLLEWHPMTVTWASQDEIALHIRARGGTTWSQKVYDHVVHESKGQIRVKLDGFYGKDLVSTFSLASKEAVIFACGGCGLTFPFSIIEKLCQQNPNIPVYICWVTRTKQEYAAFQELLQDSTSRFHNLAISVWVTLKGCSEENEQNRSFSRASASGEPPSKRSSAALWRPYPTWLWSPSIHSMVTALALLMAVSGYAVARNLELSSNMDDIRTEILKRFLGLMLPTVFALAFLFVILAPRLAPICLSACIDHGNKLRRGDSNVSEESIDHNGSECELETIELGNPPQVQGFGCRPCLGKFFSEVELAHAYNVAVLACGPKGLVDDVRYQTEKRAVSNWRMIEEEWEW